MIISAFVYAKDGTEHLGLAQLEVACSDAFCDSCGDCMCCYGDDECPAGSHRWVLYEDDLPTWFGVEMTRP